MASTFGSKAENPEHVQLPSGEDIDNILDEIEQKEQAKPPNNANWDKIVQQTRIKNIGFIKNLFLSKEIDVNSQNPSNGKTLLTYAVIIGDIDLVTAIINFGADLHIKDNDDMDALDYAMKYGRYKITELLYYRQFSGSLGNDLKNISTKIHRKNQEAKYIHDSGKELSEFVVHFMIKAITERATFDESMLYYAWYFVLKECEKEASNPFDHELWITMMNVYEAILSNTSDKEGWKWLKFQFVPSLIWYFPNPNHQPQPMDEAKTNDDADDCGEEQVKKVLKTTLFNELLERVRAESKKQSDLLLKEKIDQIKKDKPSEWNDLISYHVNTKHSSNARQDLCGCLIPKYDKDALSAEKYPPSTHFSAQKHYDTNMYLNELIFRANILDSAFQDSMKQNTKEINEATENSSVEYRAGPVKTLTRSQTKVENDYINEAYPTSAKILDINRCAIQFKTIEQMMQYIEMFSDKIQNNNAGCIKEIIRCKNGWATYDEEYPQYTDIKLNVLIQSTVDYACVGVIAEIQFLLDLMSSFKRKAHKLYSIERKFELVYNFGLLKQKMSKFKDFVNINYVFKNFAAKDDLKFFKLLWENHIPHVTSLINMERESAVLDNAIINALVSSTGNIHHYLANNYNDLYRESILFYMNKHKVIKSWDFFLDQLVLNQNDEQKKQTIKLHFVQRLIAFFDLSKTESTNLGNAVDLLRSFGVLLDLLDRDISCYVAEHKALGYDTLKTHIYDPKHQINDHQFTEFKFIDDPFKSGSLFVFGNGNKGRLGFGDNYDDCPAPVISNTFNSNQLLQIVSYNRHSLALDRNGKVHAWGLNDCGQLGIGQTHAARDRDFDHAKKKKDKKKDKDGTTNDIPQELPPFSAYKAVHVAVGKLHSLILTEDGNVWSFGRGDLGALGHPETEDVISPKLIKALEDEYITHIWCGNEHNCAVSKSGLGVDAAEKVVMIPTKVDLMGLSNAIYTDNGNDFTLVLTRQGRVVSFGSGYKGKLGHADEMDEPTPKLIEALSSKRIVDIGCGWDHSLCVTDDGELYSFGYGQFGQLGFGGDTVCQLIPKKVQYFDVEVVSCAGGASHSAVVTSDGMLFMFGKGGHGELGQGKDDIVNKNTPTKVVHKWHVLSASLGNKYSLVVARDNGEEKKENDVERLKPNEEVHVRNAMESKLYRVYIKNERLYHAADWILIAHHKEYSAFPCYANTFIGNWRMNDAMVELEHSKVDKIYHSEILQSKYALVMNQSTSEIKQESIPEDQIYGFHDIETVKLKVPAIEIKDNEATHVSIYVQPREDSAFVLLKEFKHTKKK
eukprot:1079064_1